MIKAMIKSLILLLMLVVCNFSAAFAAEKNAMGTITGKILLKSGKALSNGKVYFFKEGSGPPPSQSKYWRTPDEIVETDAEGRFTMNLAEGRYYFSAIKKMTKDLIGPPVEGDYVYPDSRADLPQGQSIYAVIKNQKTDVGVIAEAVVYKKRAAKIEEKITAIEGTVVDSNGKPVAGAIAFAFPTSKIIGKPSFVSERTGNDGKYLLKVYPGGTYYIKIRTTLKGNHPEEGEIIGVVGKDKPSAVSLKTGEILRGINIVGSAFTNLERKNPSKNKQINSFGNKL